MSQPPNQKDISAEETLRRAMDGDVLHRLPSGLMTIRRMKHEWLDQLDEISGDAFARKTDKVRGSKFLRDWTLFEYVRWIAGEVEGLGWDANTSAGEATLNLGRNVGYSKGKMVQCVCIVISSRCIHAYLVPE